MPRKALRPCRYSGCPNLTECGTSYCEVHQALYPNSMVDGKRPSASKRGYNSKWQKRRKIFLNKNPLCECCRKNGRFTMATVVDHIVSHKGNEKLFWDESNWQALCKPCHDRKTFNENL
ncbi:MAG: HNH endonuclease [Ruminococcus sp.]|nr:HNH endonuclease [Ruminococcus sp.]